MSTAVSVLNGRETAAFQASTASASAEREAFIKNFTERAKAEWDEPGFHVEMARTINELTSWGFQNSNVFSSIINTETVAEDDLVTIEEVRGMEVFATHRGGQVDQTTMTSEVFQLPRDEMAWHVAELEDDIRNNYGKFLAQLVPFVRQREEAEIYRRIFSMVQASVPATSDYYIDATSTGLVPAVLNAALTEVADTPPPSGGVSLSAPLTIIGRATALDQILDFPGYAEAAQEEIRRTGSLGTYRGASLIRLTNWQDEENVSFFPEDELFILSGNAGKFAFYGGARTKQWTENKVDYTHIRSRRTLGGAVYRPEGVRRVKLDI